MHDLVALDGHGVVAAFVASSEFVPAAAVQARALGYDRVPAVFVAHPIQDRTDPEMAALADGAWPALREALTGDAGPGWPSAPPERRAATSRQAYAARR